MCVRLPQSCRRLGCFTGACVRALPPSNAVNIMGTQNDVLLLTLVVRKNVGQLLSWTLLDGQPGLLHMFTVIVRLLQSQGESGGLVLSDLIYTYSTRHVTASSLSSYTPCSNACTQCRWQRYSATCTAPGRFPFYVYSCTPSSDLALYIMWACSQCLPATRLMVPPTPNDAQRVHLVTCPHPHPQCPQRLTLPVHSRTHTPRHSLPHPIPLQSSNNKAARHK